MAVTKALVKLKVPPYIALAVVLVANVGKVLIYDIKIKGMQQRKLLKELLILRIEESRPNFD